jgi:hypothetical protein
MGELRRLQGMGHAGERERNGFMVAWALSNTLSRDDMAMPRGFRARRSTG